MPTRVPNPLHRIYDDLQAAINEIMTLNGGEIPFANTKPGLVVGLLTNVLNAIKELLTNPTTLPLPFGCVDTKNIRPWGLIFDSDLERAFTVEVLELC